MKIIETILTKNRCYIKGQTIEVKGLMLHSIGCPQPHAQNLVSSWNTPNISVCVHAFIDGITGDVYQTLPWNRRGWHCGSGPNGSANSTHIGVEMCEPASIRYTTGANFVCSNLEDARKVARTTYASAVQLFAKLCKEYSLDPLKDGVIISHSEGHARGIASNHGDVEHIWRGLSLGLTMDGFRKDVKAAMNGQTDTQPEKQPEKTEKSVKTGIQCKDLKDLPEAEIIRKVGPLFTQNEKQTGILACVSMAQFILESGYGKTTKLALESNNCFGMKANLSNNRWGGSTWDGMIICRVATKEQDKNGREYTIMADFRAYPCIEDSVGDHSAYLIGAMNGDRRRYSGIQGEKDYKTAIHIIKAGGYATDVKYEQKICNIIERWNLTAYDYNGSEVEYEPEKTQEATKEIYRVRESWENEASQIGAFYEIENAKNAADTKAGYGVYDAGGKLVYAGKIPKKESASDGKFKVKIDTSDLNIRTGAGTNYARVMYIPRGIYTIVEVKKGLGSKAGWGRLMSGAGWISLDYATKIK